MDTTTYMGLKNETTVIENENGIVIFIPSAWIISGESRVSYTTIIRLVECCREYHWMKDVKCKDSSLDSICGETTARFIKTIRADSTITIKYSIKDILKKRYKVEFVVLDNSGNICCIVEMVSFFYDPEKMQSVEIPKDIL